MQLSNRELKKIARGNLNGNYRIAIRTFILLILITLAMDLPFSSLLRTEHPTLLQNVIYYIVEFLISIIYGVLQIGYIRFHLHMARGQEFSQKQVFDCFRSQTDRYIICVFIKTILSLFCALPVLVSAYLIYREISLFSILISIVLCLISIIAVIYINLRFYFSAYRLLDDESLSVIESFRQSSKMMIGQKWNLLCTHISFIGMDLLAIFSLGIGSLWVEPYKAQTFANFYLSLNGEIQEEISVHRTPTYVPFDQQI